MVAKNGNGNKIFWSIFSVITALVVGFSLFAGKMIFGNNREIGEQGIKIGTNTVNIKENTNTIKEVQDVIRRLETGQEVLIEKFELEKEYREKLDEKEKRATQP